MGWGRFEGTIERYRAELRRDPAGVVNAINIDITKALRPRDRVRLLLARASGKQLLGNQLGAEADLKAAARTPRCGAIARCEISGRLADFRLTEALATGAGWSAVLATSDQAVTAARHLAAQPSGHTSWAIRQARTRANLLSAALVVHGQIHLYGFGEIEEAFSDGIAALKTAPRYVHRRNSRRHPQIPACSLLALCATRGGTREHLRIAAQLVRELQAELPADDRIPHAQIRATQACIEARNGDPVEAERLLLQSLDDLRQAGAWNLYGQILSALLWVVRDRQNRPERAEYLRSQLAVQTDQRAGDL